MWGLYMPMYQEFPRGKWRGASINRTGQGYQNVMPQWVSVYRGKTDKEAEQDF